MGGSSVLTMGSLDRYDDDYEDHGQDHGHGEADDHEGDEGGDQGDEESRWQGGVEGTRQKMAAAMKKKGVGIFAPKTLSSSLASICGKSKMPRTEVTKAIWAYIKKNSLNNGRTIKPDATLKAIFPVASLDMLKMASYVSKHLS